MSSRTIPPLVSTEWLNANLHDPSLVVIDIRSPSEYEAGHIFRSINIPFAPVSKWSVIRNDLLLELPNAEDLFKTIGDAGIDENSKVVIVGKTDNTFALADAARVAFTLIYAGVKNVAILNGGINKWIQEKREITREIIETQAKKYVGEILSHMVVSKEYVLSRIGRAIIIDARDPDVYFGVNIEPFAPSRGHIPTAKNLPAPWIWNKDGTYRSEDELRNIVSNIIPNTKSEVILYCGVGGYATAWWYVLHEILGYENVKVYDGSWQEWIKDPNNPVSVYKWE
ncbi:MAG: sulfurtransferase [Desulfurococcaceae archaeon]